MRQTHLKYKVSIDQELAQSEPQSHLRNQKMGNNHHLPRLGKRELICLLLFTCNYVVSVWRGFPFVWVLGMGYVILLSHSLSLPYNYYYNARCKSGVTFGLNFYFICTIQIHQKGTKELISGMHYTNGIQKKVSRLIRICIPFCTIALFMYSILRNFHNIYKTVCILHVKNCY